MVASPPPFDLNTAPYSAPPPVTDSSLPPTEQMKSLIDIIKALNSKVKELELRLEHTNKELDLKISNLELKLELKMKDLEPRKK